MTTRLLTLILFLGLGYFAQAQDVIVTSNSDNTFTPANITIMVGQTVEWQNAGGFHNVNGSLATYPDNPEGFDNGAAASSAWTFTFTFNIPGVYNYQCDPHVGLGMVGTVTVMGGNTAADLVINEIMYNSPESGQDSLEFIELLNNGAESVDLGGFYFEGVSDTFPAFTLAAGAFVVIASDSVAFENTFEQNAFQFNGGLSNGGETVKLFDAAGMLIDSVAYEPGNGWPLGANGFGASLEFCDLDSDNNDPENWNASENATGITINEFEILASPGAANNCTPQGPATYTPRSIAEVTENDANGVATALNEQVELRGILYGNNFRPGGLQFTLIDNNNDGIHIFSDNEDFGLSPNEGDEVVVRGTIGQFRGLSQIVPDEMEILSSENNLFAPTEVADLNEDTESQFIILTNLTLVDPSQWLGSGSYNVDATDGTTTIEIRVDADTDINDVFAAGPTLPFNVIGLGGQFDQSSPFDEGYQILPRSSADIDIIVETVDVNLAQLIEVYPNPVQETLTINLEEDFDQIRVQNIFGQTVQVVQAPRATNLIDMAAFADGMYLVTFVQSGKIWSTPIIKK